MIEPFNSETDGVFYSFAHKRDFDVVCSNAHTDTFIRPHEAL